MKKEKSAAVGLVICFVAVIAIVGMITFRNNRKQTEDELAKTEEEKLNSKENEEEEEPSQITQGEHIQAEITTPVTPKPPIQEVPIERELSFSVNDTLMWPVDGNVVLNYSMDQTVYFSTLDQYKYNPALIISGEVGAEVTAAAEGEVISITEHAQTGTTVRVDLGDGYEAIYGQLKDVKVKAGERIQQGEIIGCLNEPTKYYSVEGCNLYFQLLENGEPRNPMEYLDV